MPINIPVAEDIYFSESFKVVIRSCKEILLNEATELTIVDRSFLFAHRNNFYAFLRGLGVDERLLWVIAFINDITDPTQGFENKKTIWTVTLESVDRLILPLRTKHN